MKDGISRNIIGKLEYTLFLAVSPCEAMLLC